MNATSMNIPRLGSPESAKLALPGQRSGKMSRRWFRAQNPVHRAAGIVVFGALLVLSLPFSAVAQEWHEGLCQATVDASLSFPVPGVLGKVVKKEGEAVKEGDV